MTEKATAIFSRLKQNFKISDKNTQEDKEDQEDLHNTEGRTETDGAGDIRSENNVLVEKIPSGKDETLECVTSDDLTKGR